MKNNVRYVDRIPNFQEKQIYLREDEDVAYNLNITVLAV